MVFGRRFQRLTAAWLGSMLTSVTASGQMVTPHATLGRSAPSYASATAQVPVALQPAPDQLLADLKNADAAVRRDAANQLGSIRARAGLHGLIALLSDKDSGVREAAAFALGQIADRGAAGPLLRSITDKDPEVRASAAFALGMIGDRKDIPALSKALDDIESGVRSSAITALGLIQDEEAIDEITEMLNDSSFDVRYDAVWTLGEIGESDVADSLRAALVNLDLVSMNDSLRQSFREAVQNALEKIQSRTDSTGGSETLARPRRVNSAPRTLVDSARRVTRPASVIRTVKPAFTERALRARAGGSVGLKVLVGADGRPARVYVTRRVGYGLDQRAVQAALEYRFEPGMRDGLPQTEWVNIDLQF